MANSLSVFNPEFWARTAQVLHKPKAVYRQLANSRAEAQMKKGDTFHRVLPNRTEVGNYTRYTDITQSDISGTDETLVVNTERAYRIAIDNMDEVQASVNLQQTYGGYAATDMANVMDSDFLYQTINAANSIDNGVISTGLSDGLALALNGSNVYEAVSNVTKFLSLENVDAVSDIYGVIDPYTANIIQQQLAARETIGGDKVTNNGFAGRMIRFAGIDMYVSNNYTRKEVLGLATNPTDGDTLILTVGGNAVTITFKAAPAAAGDILIGANVDETRGHLAAFLNDPGTTSGDQIALTGNDLARFETAIAASNSDADNELTLYCKGRTLTVAATLTDATDEWIANRRGAKLMFGKKGAVDGVVQVKPRMDLRKEPKHFAYNLLGASLYQFKTFTDGSQKLVDMYVTRPAGA